MRKVKLLVCIMLIISLLATGCYSKGLSSSLNGTKGTNSSPSYGLTSVSFPLKEKVTLRFLTKSSILAPADPNDKLIFQRFEKDTNLHIDWINYTSDQYNEKKNLLLASGDFPDVIFDAEFSDYDILRYSKQGVIIPVEQLIDKYMPNLKKILDLRPNYKKLLTAPDGHIYSFPWIEELGEGKEAIQALGNIPWINKKWLDELGLKIPTTTEELEKVLIAFKNSGKSDVIPMSFMINNVNEDPSILLGAFGMGDNNDHYVVTEDKKVVYTLNQEGYKNGIQWFNRLQQEGLIDSEAYTQDWNTYVAKGKNQRYGLYFTWDKANVSGNNEDYVPLPPLKGPSGQVNVARSNSFGFFKGRTVISSANQNLELTAKWIDKCYDPIQSIQDNWGTYGDKNQQNVFELTSENTLKHLSFGNISPSELRQKTSVGGPLAILDDYYGIITTKPKDAAWRLEVLRSTYVPAMKASYNFPQVFFSEEELTQLIQLETSVKAYAERMKAKWISEGGIDNQWNEYLRQLDKLDLPKILEIKQKGLDNYNVSS